MGLNAWQCGIKATLKWVAFCGSDSGGALRGVPAGVAILNGRRAENRVYKASAAEVSIAVRNPCNNWTRDPVTFQVTTTSSR